MFLGSIALFEGVHAAPTPPPLGLDGSGLDDCGRTSSQYFSVTFSTASPNDVLITWISLASWYSVVSVTDNNGLVWTLRQSVSAYPTVGYEYFAKWTTSGFENVTVQFGSANSQCSLVAFGIAGADFDDPFDPNPSILSTASGSAGAGQQPSVAINTNNSNDLLLGLINNQVLPAYNPRPGFACIAGTCNGVGTALVVAEYQVVTTTESDYAVSASTDGGYWGMIADAIQGPTDGPSLFFESNPGSFTIQAGKNANSAITLTSIDGFSGNVELSAVATPVHYPYSYSTVRIEVTLQPTTVFLSPGGKATTSLMVTPPESTPTGIYTVTITGFSGSQISLSIPLTVTPPPSFSISSIPSSLVMQLGEESATLILTSNYGFVGSVTLSTAVTPLVSHGPSLSLQKTVLNLPQGGNATTTLKVRTNSTTPIGFYVVTVRGNDDNKESSLSIFLTVKSTALDGVGTPTICGAKNQTPGGYPCAAELLTTAKGGDLVVVVANNAITSVLDSSGLTFVKRVSSASVAEYYALASRPLRSDNITAVFSTGNWANQIQAIAISGVNSDMVFDLDPSVPSFTSCSGSSLEPCSASIATSGRDFVIAVTEINDAGPCDVSSGFAEVTRLGGLFDVDYGISPRPQSNLTFTCSSSDPEAILVDAILLKTNDTMNS